MSFHDNFKVYFVLKGQDITYRFKKSYQDKFYWLFCQMFPK